MILGLEGVESHFLDAPPFTRTDTQDITQGCQKNLYHNLFAQSILGAYNEKGNNIQPDSQISKRTMTNKQARDFFGITNEDIKLTKTSI